MKVPTFSVVGMRCGDVFWTANWIRKRYEKVRLRAGRYAFDAWKAVDKATDLQVEIFEVIEDRPAVDFNDFLRQNDGEPSAKRLVGVWSPTFPYFEPSYPGRLRDLPPLKDLPDRYVCVHTGSVSRWKNRQELLEVSYPYPVVCVGSGGEPCRRDWIDKREVSWFDTLRVIWNASLIVCIASSVLSACMFLKKGPCVVCHFDSSFFPHVGPLLLGVDLLTPSQTILQRSINMCSRWTLGLSGWTPQAGQ